MGAIKNRRYYEKRIRIYKKEIKNLETKTENSNVRGLIQIYKKNLQGTRDAFQEYLDEFSIIAGHYKEKEGE